MFKVNNKDTRTTSFDVVYVSKTSSKNLLKSSGISYIYQQKKS